MVVSPCVSKAHCKKENQYTTSNAQVLEVHNLSQHLVVNHTIIVRSYFGQSRSGCIMISCSIFRPIFATLRPTSRSFGLTIMGSMTSRSIPFVTRTRTRGTRNRRCRLGGCVRLLGHRMRLRLCLITVQSTFIEISNHNSPRQQLVGKEKKNFEFTDLFSRLEYSAGLGEEVDQVLAVVCRHLLWR